MPSKPKPPGKPQPPYGTAIREAVAKGDVAEFRALLKTVEGSLSELGKLDAAFLVQGKACTDDPALYRRIEAAAKQLSKAIETLK